MEERSRFGGGREKERGPVRLFIPKKLDHEETVKQSKLTSFLNLSVFVVGFSL